MANADQCDCCGLPLDDGSHFSMGRTWCLRCWSGRRPPVSIPPSEAGKRAISVCIGPSPPAQPMLPGLQEGARHG
jgi:hypothetical protein